MARKINLWIGATMLALGPFTAQAFAQDSAAAPAQSAPPADPLSFAVGEGRAKVSIEGGIQIVGESNAFWNLSDALAPTANFDTDPVWGESYLKAGLKVEYPGKVADLEMGVSAVAARTLGRDIFNEKNRGRVVLENAYGAVRFDLGGKDNTLKLSGGSQPFAVGSGMLIGDGGVDGFERGALIFGPRRAWGQTALARLQLDKLVIEGFHLNPRELKSGDTRTIINGAKIEYVRGPGQSIGLAYGHVPRSEAPYAQAAPGGFGIPAIIANGRDGLSFVHGWFKVNPIAAQPGFFVGGEYARQRNSRIDLKASAGRFEIGNTFLSSPWRPTLSYSFQSFSGDDPDTPKLERFDPLFYDGSQAGWATGTNGSFVFINTNVRSHRLSLNVTPSPQDIITLRYVYIDANRLRSPIQFGQATRPDFTPGGPRLVSGVTKRHLSDDILIEYTRVISQNIFVTGGFGHSWPGSGLDTIAPNLKQWSGAFVNLVVQY